jgi:hypothetical protein
MSDAQGKKCGLTTAAQGLLVELPLVVRTDKGESRGEQQPARRRINTARAIGCSAVGRM